MERTYVYIARASELGPGYGTSEKLFCKGTIPARKENPLSGPGRQAP